MIPDIHCLGFLRGEEIFCEAHGPEGSEAIPDTPSTRFTMRGALCRVCGDPLVDPPPILILTGTTAKNLEKI